VGIVLLECRIGESIGIVLYIGIIYERRVNMYRIEWKRRVNSYCTVSYRRRVKRHCTASNRRGESIVIVL
jgi:hypothetical protein